MAITIDDFNVSDAPEAEVIRRNRALLDALRSHSNLKAAAFVCGRRIDNELGRKVVREWDSEGHIIGNHTYSHWYYHNRTFEQFSEDTLRCEGLIKDYPQFRRLFRFPMLKEGNTAERRDRMRAFLKEHGYKVGHVTIDASDWYVDERLRARLAKDPKADVTGYQKFYLGHIADRAAYYDDLSRKALGRSVRHTLLVHFNHLNGLFLDDLLRMFEHKGWKLISAEEAFADPVFSAQPNILPAGESIIWALAKETGKFDKLLRYPGEDGEYEKPAMDKLGL
ncbi:MAG TPA: polysaccharide deacetylase family protein [Blastocatellia bacterium]|nr:polysaccharide deacetylase family protein [Blastocatellia bacterium]